MFNWAHFNDFSYEISNDQDGDKEGWVSYSLYSYSTLEANEWPFLSRMTNQKPGEVQSWDVPTLCVITSSPRIGLSDHRPPEGGNKVFQEISSWIIIALLGV